MHVDQHHRADQARVEDLHEVLDALPSLVAFVDGAGCNRYANRAARLWLGVEPEEAYGRTVRELIGEDGFATVAPHVAAALTGTRRSFERLMGLPSGEVVHCLTEYVPRWRDGRPAGFTVLITDITRQVRAEAAQAVGARQVDTLLSRHREAAGRTDDVLQELFALSLHLDRMQRFPDRAWADLEEANESLSTTIEKLRGTIKTLLADLDRVVPTAPVDR